MKKLLATLIFLAVALSCVAPATAAEDDEDVVPEPINLAVPNRIQQTQVWCWVAVAQQVITYSQGQSPQQCALVAVANNATPAVCCSGYNQSCVRTGSMDQIRLLLLAYGGSASDVINPPRDPMVLYRHLTAGHPVILQVRTGVASTHVVVLRAMRFTRDSDGNLVAWLGVNDPMSVYTQAVEYSRLKPLLVNALVVY